MINNLENKIEELENKFVTVSFSMSSALAATLILPFDHDLPEGMTAYIATGLGSDGDVILEEITPPLKANTPYEIHGTQEAVGTYEFTGVPTNTEDKYSEGLLIGSYKDLYTANGDFRCDGTEYFLQNNDGRVAWYKVVGDVDLKLGAYHCYLDTTLA